MYLPVFLFSKLLDTGVLPSIWNRGHGTPIHKKGSRSSPNNYQPITLTSVIGKILESIVRDHILNHLTRHNLLSHEQHGFVPGKCIYFLNNLQSSWSTVTSGVPQGSLLVPLPFAIFVNDVPTLLKSYCFCLRKT